VNDASVKAGLMMNTCAGLFCFKYGDAAMNYALHYCYKYGGALQ